MSETGPSLFLEPVSCKQEQRLVWDAIPSRADLTSYRSHVISPLQYTIYCIRLGSIAYGVAHRCTVGYDMLELYEQGNKARNTACTRARMHVKFEMCM